MSLNKNVSCAGGGKTTALVNRFYELSKHSSVEHINAITFSNNATNEISHKLILKAKQDKNKNILDNLINLNIMTIDAFFQKLLNLYQPLFNFNIINYYDLEDILQKSIEIYTNDSGVDVSEFKWLYKMNRTTILLSNNFCYYDIDNEKDPQNQQKLHNLNQKLRLIEDHFLPFCNLVKQLKQQGNFYDYEDIQYELFNFIQENPEPLEYFVFNNIGHLLIDEFQDTSYMQYNTLTSIINHMLTGGNNVHAEPSVFIIGDIKQSIYNWRGADSSLFNSIIDEDTVKHNITYRCSQNIVDWLNKNLLDKCPYYEEHTAHKGYIENSKVDVNTYKDFDDLKEKLKITLNEIQTGNTAILVRTNDALQIVNRWFEEEINNQGYFFANEKVLELVNILLYVLVEDNQKSAYILKNMPFLGKLNEIRKRSKDKTISDILDDIVKKCKLSDYYEQKQLGKFITIIKSKDGTFKNKADMVIMLSNAHNNRDYLDIDKSYITEVLTMHKSKGLEYDNVIVLDVDFYNWIPKGIVKDEFDNLYMLGSFDSQVPYKCNEYERVQNKIMELSENENWSIAYVALTRARKNLYCLLQEEGKTFLGKQLISKDELQGKDIDIDVDINT